MSAFEYEKTICIDCGTGIGNGVRCSDCTIDCRECGSTFKTEADRNNHEHDGHCAACGTHLGDRPDSTLRRVTHRQEDVHEQDHFVTDGFEYYRHPITDLLMRGGYLCEDCTMDDLETPEEVDG